MEPRSTTFKYRNGRNEVVRLRADYCSGLFSQGQSFWCFRYQGTSVGQIGKSRLLPGYEEKAVRLYAKPWRDKFSQLQQIHLSERNIHEFDGLPRDAERVWGLSGDRDFWVIECETRSILHICNNPEVSRRGEFKEALKKLMPGKKITVYFPTVTAVEI